MPTILQELSDARQYVAANMLPQLAGPFASSIRLLRTENVVGGTHLCVRLTLRVQQRLFVFTRKHFNGASVCLGLGEPDDPACHATALVFAPGSVQIVGAPSAHILRLLLHKIADVLRTGGERPHMLFVSIDNRVATGSLLGPVALETMHNNVPDFITAYKPDKFPGMICMHQQHEQQMVMTLFEAGNVTALGITDQRVANELFLEMVAIASAHPPVAGVVRQKRKSEERSARLASEENACMTDSTRNDSVRGLAKAIAEAVRAYTVKNAHRLGDQAFLATQRQEIDALVKRVSADFGSGRKKRRAVAVANNAQVLLDADEELLDFGCITISATAAASSSGR